MQPPSQICRRQKVPGEGGGEGSSVGDCVTPVQVLGRKDLLLSVLKRTGFLVFSCALKSRSVSFPLPTCDLNLFK